MKVLLDECVPRKFKFKLTGHDCHTVPEADLAGRKNGELLVAAEQQGFDIFLTLDKGIAYQQSLAGRRIALILVRAASSRLDDLIPHVAACLNVIRSAKPGSIAIVE